VGERDALDRAARRQHVAIATAMTKHRPRFPPCGSLTAGALIGTAAVVAAFALTETTTVAWQAALVLGAPVILALGIALQVLVMPRLHRGS
jgi:uncharacterized membrane protein